LDADYRFNLAVACYRAGDIAAATGHLREALALKPGDSDAKSLLDSIAAEHLPGCRMHGNAGAEARIPPDRMKRNYDESLFRQLALEIQAAAKQRFAGKDPHTHARYHVTHAQELFGQGFLQESENEFREALSLDNKNAEANSGPARVLEAKRDATGARAAAAAALRLRPLADLVIGRLDLRENKAEAAAESVNRALRIEPSNGSALALKRAIAAKLAEKAQPLPNP